MVRVGDTVRRPRTEASAPVEQLLVALSGQGLAPTFLGVDDEGRQVLEHVDGDVPDGPPFDLGDARMSSAMRLVRRFHDTTAALAWTDGAETVCHGDLGPHNTVFRGDEAVRLIDFDDDVRPGRRLVDTAHAVWCYADLTEQAVPVEEQARRLALCCAAYGDVTPAEVVDELLARFGRARRDHLAAGRDGAVEVFDGLIAWTRSHRDALLAR